MINTSLAVKGAAQLVKPKMATKGSKIDDGVWKGGSPQVIVPHNNFSKIRFLIRAAILLENVAMED